MKESELERVFVNEVRRLGGEAFKWVSPGNNGVPDRIVMLPTGEIYFIELKAWDGTLRPVQTKMLERIRGEDELIVFFEIIGRAETAERLRKRFHEI